MRVRRRVSSYGNRQTGAFGFYCLPDPYWRAWIRRNAAAELWPCSTVDAVRQGVQSQVAGVGVQAIDYPAVAIPNTLDKDYLNKYAASVSSGNNKLAAYLVRFLARCSTTLWRRDLTGFSQGAQVAKTTMEKLWIDKHPITLQAWP